MPVASADEIKCGEPGVVDLWCYFLESNPDPDLFAAQAALLCSSERERCERFLLERDRRLFVASRALVRTALSSYFAVAPGDWRFSIGQHGKPSVASPLPTPRIHFNLAHTPGLAVCVVSGAHESIGVDAEMIESRREIFSDAERYFSSPERGALRACPGAKQPQLFFAFWTLKESYVKARGDGLGLSLDQFSFHFDEDAIHIVLDQSLADDATRWRFALVSASSHHLIAVAAKTGGAPLSLHTKVIVPLGKAVQTGGLSVISAFDLLK